MYTCFFIYKMVCIMSFSFFPTAHPAIAEKHLPALIPQKPVCDTVSRCIGGYTVRTQLGFLETLRVLMYQVMECVRGFFGCSDRQLAQREWASTVLASNAPNAEGAQKIQYLQELNEAVDKALTDLIRMNQGCERPERTLDNSPELIQERFDINIKNVFQQRCHQIFLPEISLASDLSSIASVMKAQNCPLRGDDKIMEESMQGSRQWGDYCLLINQPDDYTERVMKHIMDEIGFRSKSERRFERSINDPASTAPLEGTGSGKEIITESLYVTGYDTRTKLATVGSDGISHIKKGAIFFKDRTAEVILRLFNDKITFHPEIRKQIRPDCLLPDLWKIVEAYWDPWTPVAGA